MLNFYDFEVFEKDWLVVFINPAEKSITRIINDRRKLADYYVARQKEYYIGYNSSNYDQYIFKALLWGEDPKKVNDFIIKEKQIPNLTKKKIFSVKILSQILLHQLIGNTRVKIV